MLRRSAFAAVILSFSGPALGQDAAEFVVRMNRLENQVRQMSGQIEQLQFENRQLKDQVKKFQEDVEFRFQEGRGGRPAAPVVQSPAGTQTPASPAQARPQRRGDAFDPSEMPSAPGAPRPLGTTTPSAPLPPPGAHAPTTIGGLIDSDAAAGGPLDLNQ